MCLRPEVPSEIHTLRHTHVHTHVLSHTHSHMYTQTHSLYTFTHMLTDIHTHTHIYSHTHAYTHIHTHIFYTYLHTHTYTHSHTQTQKSRDKVNLANRKQSSVLSCYEGIGTHGANQASTADPGKGSIPRKDGVLRGAEGYCGKPSCPGRRQQQYKEGKQKK